MKFHSMFAPVRGFWFDADAGGTGGGTSAPGGDPGKKDASNGASQTPTTPEKGTTSTTQNTVSDPTTLLADLSTQFADFRTLFNKEMAAQRRRLKAALGGEGEGEGKDPGAAGKEESAPAGGIEQVFTLQSQVTELTTRLTAAEAVNWELSLRLEVEREARRQGFLHEEDVWPLVGRDRIGKDQKNAAAGVPEALQEIAQRYPALTSSGTRAQAPNLNAANSNTMHNAATDEAAKVKIKQRFGI